MKKRKRKTTPRSIPQNHNFMSINVKLSKHPLPVTLPPDTQEMRICKGNTEGLNHLRFIHGFISERRSPGQCILYTQLLWKPTMQYYNYRLQNKNTMG